MKSDAITLAIAETLDRYYWAFQSHDLALMREAFWVADFLGVGTDVGEFWIGWPEFEAHLGAVFATLTDARFARRTLEVRTAGDTAWFVETAIGHFITHGDRCVEEKLRTSGVALKRDGVWRLAHLHRSIPVRGFAVDYGPRPNLPDRF